MIIILDWDGTLVDSANHIVQAMQLAAADVGLSPPSPASVREIIGLGLPEALRCLFPSVSAHEVQRMRLAYSRFYSESVCGLPPFFPGVSTSLEVLGERGHRLAVATGKSRRGLDRELSERGLQTRFDVTRCADETASKPHPMMVQEILEELDAPPEEAVMVGDTVFDMEMAARSGVRKIAVSYGVHPREQLLQTEPDLIVDDFSAILEWVSAFGV